jgi:hypothetical protein
MGRRSGMLERRGQLTRSSYIARLHATAATHEAALNLGRLRASAAYELCRGNSKRVAPDVCSRMLTYADVCSRQSNPRVEGEYSRNSGLGSTCGLGFRLYMCA